FKVIEFSKDAKKIFVSHTRTFEDEKKVAEENEKQAKANSTKKAMKKVSDNLEKTTLGDVTDLAKLKSELSKAEKEKK
ncbi:MAG: 30S ribosomal protein S1, partial [Bacteroidales bacterium]|nr:30S ribosomal protein S1 [Bacteroidales bacterium]